nr:MAG TPA: hypothetical protein [Caudoviricetes sp.]
MFGKKRLNIKESVKPFARVRSVSKRFKKTFFRFSPDNTILSPFFVHFSQLSATF